MNIQILDCTLRDGSYITNGDWGKSHISNIINTLVNATIDIIEVGWLKNIKFKENSVYFNIPSQVNTFINQYPDKKFLVMMDWDRYDLDLLPEQKNTNISGIRLVFPKSKYKEALKLSHKIINKGYNLFIQLANTQYYTDKELNDIILLLNLIHPECVSIVDTFGSMYFQDLDRIANAFVNLDTTIKIGFHSHNNQQLSFALSIQFIEYFKKINRDIIIDSSLFGIGRGGGNTQTELLANYLNKFYAKMYDIPLLLKLINDTIIPIKKINKEFGNIPKYIISGMLSSHTNNVDYLEQKNIAPDINYRLISQLNYDKRISYDYDNLDSIIKTL